MLRFPSRRGAPRHLLALGIVLGAVSANASIAQAHFTLQAPASWMSQDSLGSPQKLGPCGDEGGGTATGKVTTFQSGQTITVTIDEKIFHPGHYRIALSVNDRSELPAEPPVTAGSTACGSTTIQNPPVFPVLADGVFPHTTQFTSPQSVQITLPANVTCTKCTLQVIEFMSDHGLNNPGGCFYHHCADISLQSTAVDAGAQLDAGAVADGGGGGPGDAGGVTGGGGADGGADGGAASPGKATGAGTPQSSGGCSSAGGVTSTGAGAAGLLIVAAALRRRRRR